MRLYHVTPYAYSCLRTGLDPRHDRRGKGRIWLCTKALVPWAIAHVSARHGIPRKRLYILEVRISRSQLRRRRRGIYYAKIRVVRDNLGLLSDLLI